MRQNTDDTRTKMTRGEHVLAEEQVTAAPAKQYEEEKHAGTRAEKKKRRKP